MTIWCILSLVQRDCGGIVLIGPVWDFFLATQRFEPATSGSLVLHSTTVPWQLLVFTSDNFRYLTLVHRIGGGIVLIGPVRDFLFGHTGVWTQDLWISSPTLYHCAQWLLVFTSDNFRYLTLVQRDWWWYCCEWTCERFSFDHTGVWTQDL